MSYPLMFTFHDAVSGKGFLSGVSVWGRALMCKEADGEWWIYGVHPGGMADKGGTPQEAFAKFRASYTTVLYDIAEESGSYEAFQKEVQRFYHECSPDGEAQWDNAVKALRSGEIKPEAPFSELPRRTPEERPLKVSFVRLDKMPSEEFSPESNLPDIFELPVAA